MQVLNDSCSLQDKLDTVSSTQTAPPKHDAQHMRVKEARGVPLRTPLKGGGGKDLQAILQSSDTVVSCASPALSADAHRNLWAANTDG